MEFNYKSEVVKSECSAKVVAYSVNGKDNKLVTFELEYPRYILAELNTHKLCSRNSMSSRAVPVKTMIEQTQKNPAKPVEFGKNKSGMSSDGAHDELINDYSAEQWWGLAALSASSFADQFSAAGYHKQVANRLVEPFQRMKTVFSATELDNFFKLRLAKDADPTMQQLAQCMKEAMDAAEPETLEAGEWHTPYVAHKRVCGVLQYYVDGEVVTVEEAKAISASCCAQVSYKLIDNSFDKAMSVYSRLGVGTEHFHASPFEPVATPVRPTNYKVNSGRPDTWECGVTHMDRNYDLWSGNFKNWIQLRQTLGEK